MKVKNLNLVFGITFLICFIFSGQYLKHIYKPNHIEDLLAHLQIRSNHLYLLFIAAINILAFKIKASNRFKIQTLLEATWRSCLIIAGFLLIIAFIREHTGEIKNRTFTLSGAIFTLTSIGIFLTNEIVDQIINTQKS